MTCNFKPKIKKFVFKKKKKHTHNILAAAFELYKDDISTFMLLKQVIMTRDMQYCLILLFLCLLIPLGLRKYNNNMKINSMENIKKKAI